MTPEHASCITEFLLPQIEQEIDTTARVIAAVPDTEKGYAPHPTCMTAGVLAEHIAGADIWFLEGIIAGELGPYPEASNKPMAGLADGYKSRAKELLGQIKELSGQYLAKELTFHTWVMPNVNFLQIMQKHSVHHRGQLSAYLRPMGAKVPGIYGGSADEPVTASAAGDGA